MIETPRMYNIKQRLIFLDWVINTHPDDQAALTEWANLTTAYNKLARIEKLGLRLIKGGKQPTKTYTQSSA